VKLFLCNDIIISATAIYNYKREALAFIGSKFKGVYIGGEKWKNSRLEDSRMKGVNP
jgi:hypothetical protein